MSKKVKLIALVVVFSLGAVAVAVAVADAGNLPNLEDRRALIKRGDIDVTVEDVHRYIIDRIPEEQRARALARPGALKDAIENIYLVKYLAKKGESLSHVDYKQLDWSLQFERSRRLMAHQIEAHVEAEVSGINWRQMAAEKYKAEQEKYRTEEKVRVAHILISIEKRSEEDALKLASRALEEAKSEPFQDLVARYSEDPSASTNKGDLGFFSYKQMVQPFSEVAFSLKKVGELSGPVKTQFGYHIIKLIDRIPAGRAPLEQVLDEIVVQMRQEVKKDVRQRYITDMRGESAGEDVMLDTAALDEIFSHYRFEIPEVSKNSRPSKK